MAKKLSQMTAAERVEWLHEKQNKSKAGLDTFETDLGKLSDELVGLDGWRDKDTMAGYGKSVADMLERANAYKSYYSGRDAGFDSTGIDGVIKWLNDANEIVSHNSEMYGAYDSADAYNAAVKKYADEWKEYGSLSSEQLKKKRDDYTVQRDTKNAEIDRQIKEYENLIAELNKKINDANAKNRRPDQKKVREYVHSLQTEIEGYKAKIEELKAGRYASTNTALEHYYYQALMKELGAEGYTSDKKGQFTHVLDPEGMFNYAVRATDKELEDFNAILGINGGEYDFQGLGIYELTDAEKSLYLAIGDKLGKEAADQYFKYLYGTSSDYNMALAARAGKAASDRKSDIERLLGSFGVGVNTWVAGMERGINSLFSDEGIPTYAFEYESQFDRSAMSDSKFKQGLYDIGVSVGNMAPSILATYLTGNLLGAAGVADKIGKAGIKIAQTATNAATFGTSIYGNAYNEALLNGHSKAQAMNYGALTAASEVALGELIGGIPGVGQHLSGKLIANLANKTSNVLLRLSAHLAGDAIGEFTEEYLQEVLGNVFRNLCLGENNEIKLVSEEALYSGIIGALTSAGLNVPTSIATYAGLSSTGKVYNTEASAAPDGGQITGVQALIGEGLAADPESEAYEFATLLSERALKGKTITNAQAGMLEQMIVDAAKAGKSEAATNTSDIPFQSNEGMHFTFDNMGKSGDIRVSQKFVEFFDEVLSMQDKQKISKRKYKLGSVSDSHSDIIKKTTGIDVAGYEIWIDGSAVQHTEERHGANGSADHSMANHQDVGKLLYVVNNADGGEILRNADGSLDLDNVYKNLDNTDSVKIRLYKREADGTYFVAECVPDSESRRLYVKSIYKSSDNGQVLRVQAQSSPQLTSETLHDYPVANNSIPYSDGFVKENLENDLAGYMERTNRLWSESLVSEEARGGAEGVSVSEREGNATNAPQGANLAAVAGETSVQSEAERGPWENQTAEDYEATVEKLRGQEAELPGKSQMAAVYDAENASRSDNARQNADVYAAEYKMVRQLAEVGTKVETAHRMLNGSYGGEMTLTEDQFAAAYREGRDAAAANSRENEEIDKRISEGARRKQGKVYFNGAQGVKTAQGVLFLPASGIDSDWARSKTLSEEQKAAIRFAKNVLSKYGVDVVFYSSAKNKSLPNGLYDGKRIYIDIEAGMSDSTQESLVMYAIAHELTHMAERLSPELWKRYAGLVMEILAEREGISVSELIARKQNEHEAAGVAILRKTYSESEKTSDELREMVEPLSEKGAIREIVADASQLILTRKGGLAEELAKKDAGFWGKIKELVIKAIRRMQEVLRGVPRDGVSEHLVNHLDELAVYFNEMMADTLYRAGYQERAKNTSAESNSQTDGEVQNQNRYVGDYINYDRQISEQDIVDLYSIKQNLTDRKSLFEFSSKDVQKAQKWAYKFKMELEQAGISETKSPFFRTFFGDWRAHEQNKTRCFELNQLAFVNKDQAITYVKNGIKKKILFRGDIRNIDTGFTINIGAKIYNDTLTYANRSLSRDGNQVIYFDRITILSIVQEIAENAVWLDSVVDDGKGKVNDRSFMHRFYSIAEIDGRVYIVRLSVDELNAKNGTIRRAYNINNIEISPTAVSQVYKPASTVGDNGENIPAISIANLFSIVKQYDSEFSSKNIRSEVLNEDGTPRVFEKGFVWENGRANAVNAPMYVRLEKPYVIDSGVDYATWYAEYQKGDYDGAVDPQNGIYYVEKQTQIKSAATGVDGNIGTFDSAEADVQFQFRRDGGSDRAALAEVAQAAARSAEDEEIARAYAEGLDEYREMQKELNEIHDRLEADNWGEEKLDGIERRRLIARQESLEKALESADSRLLQMEAMAPFRNLVGRESKRADDAVTEAAIEKQLAKDKKTKAKERATRTQLLARAERAMGRLYRWTAKPNKKEHVPSELLPLVKSLFDVVDVSHNFASIEKLQERLGEVQGRISELQGRGAPWSAIQSQQELAASLIERIRKLEGTRHNLTWADRLGTLKNIMSSVEGNYDASGIYVSFAPGLAEQIDGHLKTFTEKGGRVRLFDASLEDLRFYTEAIESIAYTIAETGRLYANERGAALATLGENSILRFQKEKQYLEKSEKLRGIADMYGLDALNPAYFARKLGAEAESVMGELFDGFNATIENVRVIDTFSEELRKKYKVESFTGKNERLHTFSLERGGSVTLTTSQLMTVYALSERPQGKQHLYGQGIQPFAGDIQEAVKKNTPKLTRLGDELGRIVGKGSADLSEYAKLLFGSADVHGLTEKDVKAMIEALDTNQKECVKEIKTFLRDVIAPMGNKTSQKLYLYDAFTEENYFPIETVKTFIRLMEKNQKDGDIDARSVFAVLNQGFTKQLDPKAANPIVIRGIFDVFMEHCFGMANYGGMGVAVSDTIKWLNYKRPIEQKENSQTGGNKGQVKRSDSADYIKATVNHDILDLVNSVKKGEFKDNDRVTLKKLSPKAIQKLHDITGMDFADYKIVVEARQIEHILIDHGEEGRSDHSMANVDDIAKIEFAMEEPDSIKKAGKTRAYSYMKDGKNRTADTVLYEKVIGNQSYYVVQTAVDTKAKTLFVVSAFIGPQGYKEGAPQLTDVNDPSATPKSGFAATPTTIIPQNSKMSTDETKNVAEAVSVRSAMQGAYGMAAERYIKNLLMSIEGELKGTDGARVINKLIRNAKIASVAANPRVVLQQPTAYVRAGMVLSAKNLARASKPHRSYVQEAIEKNALMYYKSLGFYDMNTSRSLLEKMKGNATGADRIREAATWAAGKADEITWGNIWLACRYEIDDYIREKKLNVKRDSDEYFELVNKKFNEVINFTQVIDSPMHKNKLMSDPDTGMKQLTAFMAEPMLTYNMVISATEEARKGRAGGKKKLAKASVIYLLQMALVAASSAIADVGRDDDEDETLLEKYGQAVLRNALGIDLDSISVGEILAGDWNILNNLPIVKEVFSLLEGYDPSRMDVSGIEKAVSAITKAYKLIAKAVSGEQALTWKNAEKTLYSAAQAISTLTGIPASNLWRLVRSLINTFSTPLL